MITRVTELAAVGAPETSAAEPRSMDPDLYAFAEDRRVDIFASRSDSTGSTFWPRRIRCPETGGTVSDVVLEGTGSVWSWTFVYAPWPGLVAPCTTPGYAAGLIDLDNSGPRVIGVLLGGLSDWSVGARVEAVPLAYLEEAGRMSSMLAFTRAGA